MSRVMTLPKIGVNMTEAIICEWLIKKGDKINKEDRILLAETDKAVQEIYATDSGIIAKLLVEVGDKVECGNGIIVLVDEGESYDQDEVSADVDKEISGEVKKESSQVNKTKEIKDKQIIISKERIKISPLAKKIAKSLNINISELTPAKPNKRIIKNDVIRFRDTKVKIDKTELIVESVEEIALTSIRKIIGKRMSKSNNEKPSVALTITVCADNLIRIRKIYKSCDRKISYNDIIIKAAAKALENHKIMNSSLKANAITLHNDINIGVAVDTSSGLIVPVLKNANKKSIVQISDDLNKIIGKINNNSCKVDDIAGGTFTITSLGMFDIEQFVPIINPPECAILAIGAITKCFVPDKDDKPILKSFMKLTLSFDHRIVDGAPAARFLQDIRYFAENPDLMI